MTTFAGTMPALITPFRKGAVDVDALRELVERCIAGGVDALVPCGTTGESVTLDEGEHTLVVRTVVEQARKRVPVIAGAGTVSTAHTIHLSEIAKEARADGILLVCPYYNRPTQAGLEAHFREVARRVDLPSILYNIPARTGVDLALETLERLADVRSIVGIKEATGNVLRGQQILARLGDRFDVLSGDDTLTLPLLSVGAKGVISVTANLLPKATSDVVRLWNDGKIAEARALHLRLAPVHESMFVEANPGPLKAALADAGHIAKEIRLPLVWPGEASLEKVRSALRTAGLRAS
jgi:4-hydroxy-tetrahydrodipicolinate synthase